MLQKDGNGDMIIKRAPKEIKRAPKGGKKKTGASCSSV